MALMNLEIKGFRGLKDFFVPSLGDVNLIVGKNNCGKTSVLEAIRLLSSGGSPIEIMKMSLERNELLRSPDETEEWYLLREAFKQAFYGRVFPESDESIFIGENDGKTQLWLSHSYYELVEQPSTEGVDENAIGDRRRVLLSSAQAGQLLKDNEEREIREALGVRQARTANPTLFRLTRGSMSRFDVEATLGRLKPVCKWSYVPSRVLSYDELAASWDAIALTPAEQYVIRALRFVEPDIERLTFVETENLDQHKRRLTGATGVFSSSRKTSRVPIVSIKGTNARVSLGSMGEGIQRILQMFLGFFAAEPGAFLIDEFENGLHYSVQPKIWKLLFELSNDFNTQIFATTHSRDCVTTFRDAAMGNPASGVLFRVAAPVDDSENRHHVLTYSEEQLEQLIDSDIEVR